ncbi:MAG: hypothetical protein KAI66_07165 [Lentisphaeria bacterium]|nr:hypothetical protein [Lentisphaeria bacterium]
MRDALCALILLVTILETPAGSQTMLPLAHILVHAPMDREEGRAWVRYGALRREPLPFSRDSKAMLPDGALVGNGQPRFVVGREHEAILLEGGHYQWGQRGTTNWLSASAADLEPSAWVASDRLLCKRSTLGGTDRATLLATALKPATLLSPETPLPHRAEFHIASVHVRLASPGGSIRLSVLCGEHTFGAETAVSAKNDEWQRLFVRFKLPKDASPTVRMRLELAGQTSVLLSRAMLEQAAQHYHNRQTPSSWIPGRTHRHLERIVVPILPETFQPMGGTIAFWVKPLDQTTLSTYVAVGAGWTVPLRIEKRSDDSVRATLGKKRLELGRIPRQEWSHITLVWNAQSASAYLNGTQQAHLALDAPPLPNLETMIDKGYLLGIGTDDLGTFARSTGANAAMDEFLVFDTPLTAEQVAALAANPNILAGAYPELSVDTSTFRRAYGREERNGSARLPVHGRGPLQVCIDKQTVLDRKLRWYSADTIEVRVQPAGLLSGLHELLLSTPGGTASSRVSFRVGPAKLRDRFHVVGWNVPSDKLAEFAAAGGTVNSSHPDMRAERLHVRRGLWGMWRFSERASPPLDAPESWRTIRPDAKPGAVFLANSAVREAAFAHATQRIEDAHRHPFLLMALINTEWHASMDFSPASLEHASERFGLDLAQWPLDKALIEQFGPQAIEAAEAGIAEKESSRTGRRQPVLRPFNLLCPQHLPQPFQPAAGTIRASNPLYAYTQWWHREQALAPFNDALADIFRAKVPGIQPLFDPMLRGPSIRRYRKMRYAQEWVYVQNPLAMIPVQEALATICQDLSMKPTGMPQFLFKAGTAAPFSSTPPGDIMIEATWLACARPIDMMTYWGWQLVFGPGKMLTPQKAQELFGDLSWDEARKKARSMKIRGGPHLWHAGAFEAFHTLDETLFTPYGELIRRWENAPRHIAIVKSLASEVFSTERWWSAHAHGPGAIALAATGLPHDVLYDEDCTRARLAQYEALVLPAVRVLPENAFAAVRDFADKGGVVLADAEFAKFVPGATPIPEWAAAHLHQALEALGCSKALRPIPQPGAFTVNELELDDTRYLVAVNDLRVPGPLLGKWKKVRETGQAQTVRIGLPDTDWTAAYDLTRSRPLKGAPGASATIDLPAAGGVILAFCKQRFGQISLEARATRKSNDTFRAVELQIHAKDDEGRRFRSPVPCSVRILRPDGTEDDHSQSLLLRNGRATLLFSATDIPGDAPWRIQVREQLTGTTQICELRRL